MAFSGGKGVHVHIFIKPPSMSENLRKELSTYDVDVSRVLRQTLFEELVKRSGFDTKHAGVDFGKINFSHHKKGSQVRMIGTTRPSDMFKTLITTIPDEKPEMPEDQPPLKFPTKPPEQWNIINTPFHKSVEKALLGEITRAEHTHEYNLEEYDLKDTKITDYPCIKMLFKKGLRKGRYYGAFAIANLCSDTDYTKTETEKQVKKFLKKCDLTKDEADLRLNNTMSDFGQYHFSCGALKDKIGKEMCDFSRCPIKKKTQRKNTRFGTPEHRTNKKPSTIPTRRAQ